MLKSLTQMPISRRLPLTMAAIVVVLAAVMGTVLYTQAASMLVQSARVTLAGLAKDQAMAVKAWYDTTERHVASKASTPLPGRAILQLKRALMEDADDMRAAREGFIDNNPFPHAERARLDSAQDGTSYSEIHPDIHAQLRSTAQKFNYYDIFLFDTDGRLLYSVAKEDDFGQDFANGPLKDSGLGQAFRAAITAEKGQVITTDFAAYAPSGGAPAAFMASPVFSPSGRVLGVMAFQLPDDAIAGLLTRSSALGAHGDMYIIGSDGAARSASRFEERFDTLDPLGHLSFVQAFMAGETGFFEDVAGASGHASLADSYKIPVDFANWALVTELDTTEALSGLVTMRNNVLLFAVLGLAAAVGISLMASRAITRPLGAFVTSMEKVAEGDYASPVAVADRADEIGTLGRNLLAFRDQLAETKRLDAARAAEAQDQKRVVTELGEALQSLSQGDLTREIETDFPEAYERLRSDFNATVSGLRILMIAVADNAAEIRLNADELNAASDDLARRTESQAATLEETAAALEELSTSVKSAAAKAGEVDNTVRATRSDAQASGRIVEEAVSAMSQIKKSSDGIAQIIGVIDDIAFQTNLLALNAGVEAARAGESGQGFAVVASEVRALAQRSAEAAKQIKELISASTGQVETGVGLVNRTGETLSEIVERISQISGLVSDIAGSAQEQSVGLGEISLGMGELDKVGQQNAAMVEEGTAASTTLKQEAETLQGHVARFRIKPADAAPDQPAASDDLRETTQAPTAQPARSASAPRLSATTTARALPPEPAPPPEPPRRAASAGASTAAAAAAPIVLEHAPGEEWSDF